MSQVKPEPYLPEPELIQLGCRPWDAPSVGSVSGLQKWNSPGRRHELLRPLRFDEPQAGKRRCLLPGSVSVSEASGRPPSETPGSTSNDSRTRRPSSPRPSGGGSGSGYSQSGIDSRNPEVANRSKVGRDWLIAIGQEPDWSIELDAKGRPKKAAPTAAVDRVPSPGDPSQPKSPGPSLASDHRPEPGLALKPT